VVHEADDEYKQPGANDWCRLDWPCWRLDGR
jgi:hypothetical protein